MTTADEIKQAVLSLPEAEYAKVMGLASRVGRGGLGPGVRGGRAGWQAGLPEG